MQLTINGESRRLDPSPQTIAELITVLKLDMGRVALEQNRQIVPRSQYGATVLSDGDQIEIVSFIGGG